MAKDSNHRLKIHTWKARAKAMNAPAGEKTPRYWRAGPWNPETEKVLISLWGTHTPTQIAEAVNLWLENDARTKGQVWRRRTPDAGVMYRAAKLRIISTQKASAFHKKVKKLRTQKSKPWGTKEWKEKRASVLKATCEWCGSKKNLVLHHTNEAKLTDEEYVLLEKDVVTICRRCHLAHHRGMHLCPECKTKYKSDLYPYCYDCAAKKDLVCRVMTEAEMAEYYAEYERIGRIADEQLRQTEADDLMGRFAGRHPRI